jgi:sec-independent protein translocase protein TatC
VSSTSTKKAERAPKDNDGRMSLGEHLIELRNRGMIAAASILVAAIGGWFLFPIVWHAMAAPIHEIGQHRNATINFGTMTGAFDLQMQVAIYIGIVISSPVWLYEIFAFLTPGLTGKEKRYIFGFFFTAIPLFLGGCAFGWYVTPHLINVFQSFTPQGDASYLQAQDYFGFILKLVLAVGVAFVTPVFIVLLNMIGVISAQSILKAWRWAILGSIIFAALATPSTDIISMLILAVPLIMLYFGAAAFTWVHDRRKAKNEEKLEEEYAA